MKAKKVVGGVYYEMGVVRFYVLNTAVTANVTTVTGGRAGDLVKTNHATGRASLFVLDAANPPKAQFLTNA